MGNERRRSENSKRIIVEQRQWAAMCQLAEEGVDEEEEDEETWQRGNDLVAVGSVKPVVGTLGLHVISVAKAKKKPKKKK